MCRLFGIAANRPVDLYFSFEYGADTTFTELGFWNPHGWGLAGYDYRGERAAWVVKEPCPAPDSGRRAALTGKAISPIYIGHVRYATHGGTSEENTHPFVHGPWIFAHNGTIENPGALREELDEEHRTAIRGETDSEVAFLRLLQAIDEERGNVAAAVAAVAARIPDDLFNFLLSDGCSLYAYRQGIGFHYVDRSPGNEMPRGQAENVRTLLKSKALLGQRAVLVCSEPLTSENWTELRDRHLLTVERGRIRGVVPIH